MAGPQTFILVTSGILTVRNKLLVRETRVDASTSCSLVISASEPAPSSVGGSGVSAGSLSVYGDGMSKLTGETVAVVEIDGLTDGCNVENVGAVGDGVPVFNDGPGACA